MKRGISFLENLSIEDKLIINFSKDNCFTNNKVEIEKLLKESLDWNKLVQQSRTHRVIPYVYLGLKACQSAKPPAKIIQQLKEEYMANTFLTTIFSIELKKIISSLNKNKIKGLVLKGAILSDKVYPEPSFRTYSDIDILVQESDFEMTERLLVDMGFMLLEQNRSLIANEGRTQTHYQNTIGCVVDLHMEAMNNKWYPSVTKYFRDTIWGNIQCASFDGDKIYVMIAEHLVIYHCIHLSVHHNFRRLIWFKDIDQIVRHEKGLNWDDIVNIAITYRLQTYCYYSLLLTASLLETPIPDSVLRRLRPKYLSARLFEKMLYHENLMNIYVDRRGKAEQSWMLLRDNLSERIAALWWRCFPSIQWYLHYYSFLPRTKEIYYYPLYPLLIIMRLIIRPYEKRKVG